MIKKKISYTDYDGNKREEEFYFNLSKSELAEWEYTSPQGGLQEYIKKIIAAKNTPEIYRLFKEVIMKSYGVKSEDGRRFIKSKELSMEFEQTEAFSELVMELLGKPDKANEFIEGLININELQKYADANKLTNN